MTPREHALRVAFLEAIAEYAKVELAKARKGAEPVFAVVRKDGGKQLAVMLPGGEEIGLISIKAGVPTVTADEDELLAWVREHSPDDIEEYIDPQALSDAEVIDMIKACFPDSVKERLRPAARESLLKEMTESGGFVADKQTGDLELLGTIENHDPTGAFVLSGAGAKARRDRIMTEWQRGNLRELALGPLALPEPPLPESMFRDGKGFLGPEEAAAHAQMVQGGYSTPPIEAYRMIRDGGVGAERALAWLKEHGLDPADPREGNNTPWPLPPAETEGASVA